jgi:uncharacterized radical SAM superfamily Fe-S cluster-containing enzyme
MSPYFLDAVRYARKVGYNSVQAATNGIEFAKSPDFAKAAAEAGLRYAYLQFDGIGNAANSHRRVGNLFDVKLRAIENLHNAGVDIVPVITIVNGVNNEQVGRVIEFALDNPKRINFLSFQPVSFTGRDEEVTPERRAAQRYTLSHLAHDVKNQTGIGVPTRDWFPISFMSTFTDWADVVHGPDREWGQLTCGCHPNCGIGMAVMIDKETKEAVPVTAFLRADQLARDVAQVNDAARGKTLSIAGMALALMRNYDPFKAPTHFRIADLMKKFDKTFGATGKNYGKVTGDRTRDDIEQRRSDRWNFLFIAGMWFQDLFNYDFRRTEMCIIPYATQQGEISFCAYNTGIGWRNIIEKMHMTATLTKWYEEHGRHEIFAGNKHVPLSSRDHSLVLNAEAVAAGRQTDLDELGIAKNAREEKLQARKKQMTPDELRHHEDMERLYRQQVLKEQPTIQIQGLGTRRKQEVAEVVHKPTVWVTAHTRNEPDSSIQLPGSLSLSVCSRSVLNGFRSAQTCTAEQLSLRALGSDHLQRFDLQHRTRSGRSRGGSRACRLNGSCNLDLMVHMRRDCLLLTLELITRRRRGTGCTYRARARCCFRIGQNELRSGTTSSRRCATRSRRGRRRVLDTPTDRHLRRRLRSGRRRWSLALSRRRSWSRLLTLSARLLGPRRPARRLALSGRHNNQRRRDE